MPVSRPTCLDENTVLAIVLGELPAASRAEAQRHLSVCEDCRNLLAELARCSEGPAPRAAAPGRK